MLNVVYKCTCTREETPVAIEYRDPDVPSDIWMLGVRAALKADHARRAPWCDLSYLEYVKIPHPDKTVLLGVKPNLPRPLDNIAPLDTAEWQKHRIENIA